MGVEKQSAAGLKDTAHRKLADNNKDTTNEKVQTDFGSV
jgi:hypothetical protein